MSLENCKRLARIVTQDMSVLNSLIEEYDSDGLTPEKLWYLKVLSRDMSSILLRLAETAGMR